MASVHGVSCDMVKGAGASLAERAEIWNTPGMDGVGAHQVGRHDGAFQFEAVLYGTSAAVDSWFESIEAQQAKIGTIVDDWGTNHSACLIVHVGQRIKQAATLPGSALEAIGRIVVTGRKTA